MRAYTIKYVFIVSCPQQREREILLGAVDHKKTMDFYSVVTRSNDLARIDDSSRSEHGRVFSSWSELEPTSPYGLSLIFARSLGLVTGCIYYYLLYCTILCTDVILYTWTAMCSRIQQQLLRTVFSFRSHQPQFINTYAGNFVHRNTFNTTPSKSRLYFF